MQLFLHSEKYFRKEIALIKRLLKNKQGSNFPDACVILIVFFLLLAISIKTFSVFVLKHKLDIFAEELCRTASVNGCVGAATDAKAQKLREKIGINPNITWSKVGRLQINEEIFIEVSVKENMGLSGSFGSFPITITSKAVGTSEVYYK